MASRYCAGTPESQYDQSPKVIPKGHDQGVAWKDQFYDEKHAPFCSNERVPSSGPEEGVDYQQGILRLMAEADSYLIAFARGVDLHLETVCCRVDSLMDQVFRGPEMMKKPDVVRYGAGFRPLYPSDALDWMGYFDQRARLEFGQASGPEPKFPLSGVVWVTLSRCVLHVQNVYQGCTAYDLFSKDQGWCYAKPYNELWRREWVGTKNAKSKWKDTVLCPPDEDHEPVFQTASSTPPAPTTGSTRSTAPEAPMVAANSIVPDAASPVVKSAIPTPTIFPLTSRAATIAAPPQTPKKRKPLPMTGAQKPDQKRRRPSSSSPSRQPRASKLPIMGTFKQQPQIIVGNDDPSKTGQSAVGRDASVAIASNTTNIQSKAKPSGSGPTLTKTERERAKAAQLDDYNVGQDATKPCRAYRRGPRPCRVARDPI